MYLNLSLDIHITLEFPTYVLPFIYNKCRPGQDPPPPKPGSQEVGSMGSSSSRQLSAQQQGTSDSPPHGASFAGLNGRFVAGDLHRTYSNNSAPHPLAAPALAVSPRVTGPSITDVLTRHGQLSAPEQAWLEAIKTGQIKVSPPPAPPSAIPRTDCAQPVRTC